MSANRAKISSNDPPREEYLESFEYRMVLLLMKYRVIAGISGAKVVHELMQDASLATCNTLMEMMEDGNVELTQSQIETIAKMIAEAFGYEYSQFFNMLKYVAMYYQPTKEPRTNLRRVMTAICDITKEMQGFLTL